MNCCNKPKLEFAQNGNTGQWFEVCLNCNQGVEI